MSEETTLVEKGFDPAAYLTDLKGKAYLPVAARVLWFRADHPIESGWQIHTLCLEGSYKEGYAVYRCDILDPDGRLVATGHNVEDKEGFGDFLQKSETAAIGRALAACGYGTMAAMDEGEVVDAPQERRKNGAVLSRPAAGAAGTGARVDAAPGRQPGRAAEVRDAAGAPVGKASGPAGHCQIDGCGKPLTATMLGRSQSRAQMNLCARHLEEILAP